MFSVVLNVYCLAFSCVVMCSRHRVKSAGDDSSTGRSRNSDTIRRNSHKSQDLPGIFSSSEGTGEENEANGADEQMDVVKNDVAGKDDWGDCANYPDTKCEGTGEENSADSAMNALQLLFPDGECFNPQGDEIASNIMRECGINPAEIDNFICEVMNVLPVDGISSEESATLLPSDDIPAEKEEGRVKDGKKKAEKAQEDKDHLDNDGSRAGLTSNLKRKNSDGIVHGKRDSCEEADTYGKNPRLSKDYGKDMYEELEEHYGPGDVFDSEHLPSCCAETRIRGAEMDEAESHSSGKDKSYGLVEDREWIPENEEDISELSKGDRERCLRKKIDAYGIKLTVQEDGSVLMRKGEEEKEDSESLDENIKLFVESIDSIRRIEFSARSTAYLFNFDNYRECPERTTEITEGRLSTNQTKPPSTASSSDSVSEEGREERMNNGEVAATVENLVSLRKRLEIQQPSTQGAGNVCSGTEEQATETERGADMPGSNGGAGVDNSHGGALKKRISDVMSLFNRHVNGTEFVFDLQSCKVKYVENSGKRRWMVLGDNTPDSFVVCEDTVRKLIVVLRAFPVSMLLYLTFFSAAAHSKQIAIHSLEDPDQPSRTGVLTHVLTLDPLVFPPGIAFFGRYFYRGFVFDREEMTGDKEYIGRVCSRCPECSKLGFLSVRKETERELGSELRKVTEFHLIEPNKAVDLKIEVDYYPPPSSQLSETQGSAEERAHNPNPVLNSDHTYARLSTRRNKREKK